MVNPLWCYCADTYRQKGVEKECLHFQNQYGGNVNVLLLCCWLGSQGVSLNSKTIAEVNQLIKQWDLSVVTELREVRLFLKQQENNVLYSQAKELELFSEQILQNALYKWCRAKSLSKSAGLKVRENVFSYAGKLCDVDSCLASVLKAAEVQAK